MLDAPKRGGGRLASVMGVSWPWGPDVAPGKAVIPVGLKVTGAELSDEARQSVGRWGEEAVPRAPPTGPQAVGVGGGGGVGVLGIADVSDFFWGWGSESFPPPFSTPFSSAVFLYFVFPPCNQYFNFRDHVHTYAYDPSRPTNHRCLECVLTILVFCA